MTKTLGTEISINVKITVKWTVLGRVQMFCKNFIRNIISDYIQTYTFFVLIQHNIWWSYFNKGYFKTISTKQIPNR